MTHNHKIVVQVNFRKFVEQVYCVYVIGIRQVFLTLVNMIIKDVHDLRDTVTKPLQGHCAQMSMRQVRQSNSSFKRKVFSWRRNDASDCAFLAAVGVLFHARAAGTGWAGSPTSESFVGGIKLKSRI